jgi:hypothetical protein
VGFRRVCVRPSRRWAGGVAVSAALARGHPDGRLRCGCRLRRQRLSPRASRIPRLRGGHGERHHDGPARVRVGHAGGRLPGLRHAAVSESRRDGGGPRPRRRGGEPRLVAARRRCQRDRATASSGARIGPTQHEKRPGAARARSVCSSLGSCTTCWPTTSRSSTCSREWRCTCWTSNPSRPAQLCRPSTRQARRRWVSCAQSSTCCTAAWVRPGRTASPGRGRLGLPRRACATLRASCDGPERPVSMSSWPSTARRGRCPPASTWRRSGLCRSHSPTSFATPAATPAPRCGSCTVPPSWSCRSTTTATAFAPRQAGRRRPPMARATVSPVCASGCRLWTAHSSPAPSRSGIPRPGAVPAAG